MAYTFDLAAWKRVPFADGHEIHEAQRNPLYQDSEAYRQAFAEKLSISGDIGPQGYTGRRLNQIHVATPGQNTLQETELNSEDFSPVTKEELQQYADLHADNPLALDPSLMIKPRVAPKPKGPVQVQLSPEQQKAQDQAVAEYVGRVASGVINTPTGTPEGDITR